MKYVFDIDGTICDKKINDDYDKCFPYLGRIELVNKLYDEGKCYCFPHCQRNGKAQ